jgi:uncharacterized protein YbaP (TraB family)
MKKFALLGLMALLSFPVLRAQDALPLEKSLLWEISGKDLAKTSYLYGTIHMIGSEDFFLTEETQASFSQAEEVVFEIDMEEMSNVFVQFSLLMDLFMEDGKTLRDLLDEADYKLVKEHFDDMGMPLMLLERIKPLFLSVFASGDIDQEGFSSGEVVSYEMEFMEMAQKAKKEIGGLETIEFQMSLFDSIPYKAQADMLVESIRAEKTEDSDQSFQALVEMYKSQDLEAMAGSLEENDAMAGTYETILLSDRNANWIPVMQEMMQQKSCFFAVGAAHLGGSGGVIALLRKAGYTLRPLHIQP